MKVTLDNPDVLREFWKIIPRFSYADVYHFEFTPDGWLYFTVSGWSIGFRSRISTSYSEKAGLSFSLLASDFMDDIPEDDSVEWDVNPSMQCVSCVTSAGAVKTYVMHKSPAGKFQPTGGVEYDIDLEAVEDAMAADSRTEVMHVSGGKVYVHDPLSWSAPIYRVDLAGDVENFATSTALVRLALGMPYETKTRVTPTHVFIADDKHGTYAYAERYSENPNYANASLQFELLSATPAVMAPVPNEVCHLLNERKGAVELLIEDNAFVVKSDGAEVVRVPMVEEGYEFRTWVEVSEFCRALKVCGYSTKISLTTAIGRQALLVRGAEGAALLPTLGG